ncbi:hypothetical protein NMG60_11035512 [Bertholletia excelsa]
MVRTAYFDDYGMKKGAWSAEEDEKLKAYILRYGHWNWRELPKYAGLSRCGKSCRLRWMNYLRPNVRRGNYTKEEEDLIIKMHEERGNKWSAIATKLPGRTDNEIKNHWHTHLKKRVKRQNQSGASEIKGRSARMSRHEDTAHGSFCDNTQKTEFAAKDVAEALHPPILESFALSPEPSSSSEISVPAPSIGDNWVSEDGMTSATEISDQAPSIGGNWVSDDGMTSSSEISDQAPSVRSNWVSEDE